MKSSSLFAFATAAALCAAPASAQVRFPFSRQYRSGNSQDSSHSNEDTSTTTAAARSADRRQTLSQEFSAMYWTYVVNASVGTPPQDVQMSLTVSADKSWVEDAEYSYDYGEGDFWANESSTFVGDGEETFNVEYVDGNRAYGDSMRETLWVGGAALPNLTMGLASVSSTYMGVLALGFNDSFSGEPNVPDLMVAEGLIESPAYSLWIDDEGSEVAPASGNVLFGAVDRAAFEPPLIRFPIYSHEVDWRSDNGWDVRLASLNYTRTPGGTMRPLLDNLTAVEDTVVYFDPSFSLSTLPSYLAHPIWELAGAEYDDLYEQAMIPCAAATNLTARLALQLYGPDGPVIDVPLRDLVLADEYDTYDGATRCVFGLTNGTSDVFGSSTGTSDESWSLGAPMLKRAYAVFDIANRELGIAKVKSGGSMAEDDLVTFSTYGAEIPESTLATRWCDDRYDYCPDDDGTGSRPHRSDYDPGISGAPLVGVVIGSIVGGALVVLGIIWAIMACYRRKLAKQYDADNNEKGQAQMAAAIVTTNEPEQSPALPPRPPVAPIDVAAVTGEPSGSGVPEPQHAPPPQPTAASGAQQAEASGTAHEPEAPAPAPVERPVSSDADGPSASEAVSHEPDRAPPSPPQSPAPNDAEQPETSLAEADRDGDATNRAPTSTPPPPPESSGAERRASPSR